MSSTRTSRSWRVTRSWPDPSRSSSNTVGIVRTGIPRSRQAVDDAPAQLARGRRDGDDDLVGLHLVEHAGQVGVGVAQDLEAVLVLDAPLAGIVVEETDRGQPEPGVARQLADDEAAALATADDEHLARALAGADGADAPLDDELHGEARADEQRQGEQEERAR